MSAEDNATAIDEHDLANRLFCADGADAWVVEIKQLTGQGQLYHVFCGDWFRPVDHGEDFEAGIHAMDDFGFDWQLAPDVIADIRRFIVQHLG
jgi:hypothetical protein